MVLANLVAHSPHQIAIKIMLPNERFALERRAYYESIGLVVDATNGEFAHCPYPEGMCETGYYLLHDDHQHQGILQSRDVGKLCFWVGHARQWLLTCDPIPENYFELWDIYDEFVNERLNKVHEKVHAEKDKDGKSLHAIKMSEKAHAEKNEDGKSLHSLKLHKEKNEDGKSVLGLKSAERTNAEKDELGRSLAVMKVNRQMWESTIDGFRSSPGPVAYHNKARGWDPNARIRIS